MIAKVCTIAQKDGIKRDLAVSQSRIGEALVVLGNHQGALAAFRLSHAISEALALRDPANSEWQLDLIVSFVKLSEVTNDKVYAEKALDLAVGMRQRGILAPRDAWMIEELTQRLGR